METLSAVTSLVCLFMAVLAAYGAWVYHRALKSSWILLFTPGEGDPPSAEEMVEQRRRLTLSALVWLLFALVSGFFWLN